MRALQLFGDRDLRLTEVEPPAPPGPGEVRVRIRAVGLNFIDVWGYRGMAFAKRRLPLIVGAEAAGEIESVGDGVTGLTVGARVVPYGALTCGRCKACREGRDNLCEDVGGVMGFHVDGFARELVTLPARLAVRAPEGVSDTDAACAGIAFGTVQHMLFDNARLEPGESVLVHAGGSGVGTAAIRMAKAIGCTVYATVGDDEKGAKAAELGADHVINYRTERFCLKRGGRLVTCGSTSGVSATMNLMQLFQQQYRITGSFGCSLANIGQALDKMAAGIRPVVDTVYPLADFAQGLERLESRKVFGKILVSL